MVIFPLSHAGFTPVTLTGEAAVIVPCVNNSNNTNLNTNLTQANYQSSENITNSFLMMSKYNTLESNV